jgi:5-(carboxyamino)imidazole ribonucleotide mutase
MRKSTVAPRVGVVMGSRSDWETMRHAADMLAALGIEHEVEVVSAHRTPDKLFAYAEDAAARGIEVIIAGAGGAAHLPGMLAAKTRLPVLGVPVQSRALKGLDSLLSIAQMPAGVPVGTLAIGEAGAKNAGLLAAAIVALHDTKVARALDQFRDTQTEDVLHHSDPRLTPPHPAPVAKGKPRKRNAR